MGKGVFNKKKLNDLIVYGLGQGVNILGPLLVMPHLISVCGERGLGKIGVGFSIALILNGIVDYGSYINGVRDISINRNDRNYVTKKFQDIYASKTILLAGVLSVFSILILTVPYLAKEKTLFFFSLAMVVGQYLSPAWYFQGLESFKAISFANILAKAIYIGCVFAFINTPSAYVLANLFFGLGTVVANGIILIYLLKSNKITLLGNGLNGGLKILKEEMSFSFSQFFLSLYQYFPIVAISYIGGDFMAGQFRIIDQIVSVFKSYLNMFFYFSYSNICYDINKSLRFGLKTWMSYNGINFILMLAGLTMVFFGTDLLFDYFRVDAAVSENLGYYFRIGLSIPLLISVSLPLRQLMFAFEKNRIYITITILATCLNIALLLFLTALNGLAGSLLSIILVEVVVITLYLAILSRHLIKALKLN